LRRELLSDMLILRALWGLRRELLSDMLILGGISGVVYGLALVHGPSAWIAAGAVLALSGWRLGTR